MTELTRQCLSLDRGKREKLVRLLQESLKRKVPVDKNRFQTLYDIATEMFGNGILANARDYNLVLGRRFIAYQMRTEGCSYMEISKCLAKNHTSIIHMYKAMEDVFKYPQIRKLEMAYWQEFERKLKEHDNDTTRNVQKNS